MVKYRAQERHSLLYNVLKEQIVLTDTEIIDTLEASASVLYQERQYLLDKYSNEIVYDKRKKRLIWIGEGSPNITPKLEIIFCEIYDKCKDDKDQFNVDVLIDNLACTRNFTLSPAISYVQKKILSGDLYQIKKEIYKKK